MPKLLIEDPGASKGRERILTRAGMKSTFGGRTWMRPLHSIHSPTYPQMSGNEPKGFGSIFIGTDLLREDPF